jgi:sec-independent protein translocase protein TatB
MFDVGFQELVLIGVVALLVVGPERLPRLARTAGLWLGRARRVLGSVKAEIDRELKADELREILRKQAASNPLHTILEDLNEQPHRKIPADGAAGNELVSGAGIKGGAGGDQPATHPAPLGAAAEPSAPRQTRPVDAAGAPGVDPRG